MNNVKYHAIATHDQNLIQLTVTVINLLDIISVACFADWIVAGFGFLKTIGVDSFTLARARFYAP